MPGGLQIVVSTRLEQLLEGLATAMEAERRAGRVDAFAEEWIVVPSQGLRRWVELGLADRFGIAGGLRMPFLADLFEDLAQRVLPEQSATAPEHLHWAVFAGLRAAAEGTAPGTYDDLRHYLEGDGERQLRRGQLAARIVDRFEEYRAYRPELLAAWESGTPYGDEEARKRLGDHERWQRALWRSLVGAEGPGVRRRDLLARLTDPAPLPRDLPGPLHVFGFGTLPPPALEMLHATARRVPVHLWIVSPSSEFWSDVRKGRGDQDDVGNPLLASLARPARETFDALLALEDLADPAVPFELEVPEDEEQREPDELEAAGSLLAVLQHDIHRVFARGADKTGDDLERPLDAAAFADDDSLEIHCCHGPLRELEVLRDRVLDALHRDPSLRPDDVVVLVPEIESWAPFLDAAFGAVTRDDGEPLLPYHLADRSAFGTDPLAAAFRHVVDLVGERLTRDQVLGLLEHEPIRLRFGLTADDVIRCRELADLGGIRWGESAERRHQLFDVPALATATWAEGRDRLLAGYALGPAAADALLDLPSGALLPAADATTGRAALLGRLLDLQETLFAVLRDLETPKPLGEHVLALRGVVDRLLDVPGEPLFESSAWRLRDVLRDAFPSAPPAGTGEEPERIAFPPVREFARDAVERAFAARAVDFPSGRITVCALRPLRTVPFRLVCVAGLADGAFPRSDRELPFDLIRADRQPGDRSTRADDRLLFLETLLAARERLLLSYTGRSARDDSELAPSTCLAELCDQIDRTLRADSDTPPHRAFLVQAPLQAFDRRHFDGVEPRLHSRSPGDLAAAQALGEGLPVPPLAAPAPYDWDPREGATPTVSVDELLTFWKDPARHFVRRVLHASLMEFEESADDTEVLSTDALQDYLAREVLAAGDPTDPDSLRRLQQLSLLPAGATAAPQWELMADDVLGWQRNCPPPAACMEVPVDALLTWPAGARVRIVGERSGATRWGVATARPAKGKPRDQLRLWILHLLACWQPTTDDGPRPAWHVALDGVTRFEPLQPDAAAKALRPLVEGLLCGHAGPLPFRPDDAETSVTKGSDDDALAKLARAWRAAARAGGSNSGFGTRLAPEQKLAFRQGSPYAPPEPYRHWVDAVQRPLVDARSDDTIDPADLPWRRATEEA